MSDLTLITAAVAAASSFGFLAALALSLVLFLTCLSLRRKARLLQRALDRANRDKREQSVQLARLGSEKAGLCFQNARLVGQVRDLGLQRRVLGFALFDAVDELSAAEVELRSANRQLHAVRLRCARYEETLHDTRNTLRLTERLLGAANAERRRLRREVEDLEGALWGRNVRGWFDDSLPADALADYSLPTIRDTLLNGTWRLAPRFDPVCLFVTAALNDASRPAPSNLVGIAYGGRVKFSWTRNATDNIGVEFSINEGQWRPLGTPDATTVEFIVPTPSTTTFKVRNVWDTWTPYSAAAAVAVATRPTAA